MSFVLFPVDPILAKCSRCDKYPEISELRVIAISTLSCNIVSQHYLFPNFLNQGAFPAF